MLSDLRIFSEEQTATRSAYDKGGVTAGGWARYIFGVKNRSPSQLSSIAQECCTVGGNIYAAR